MTTLNDVKPIPIKDFGCFVGNIEGTLLCAAMNKNGSIDMDGEEINWCEVSGPESQNYLNQVNALLNTDFIMADFGNSREQAVEVASKRS